jgi:hypothetical protein
MLSIIMKPTIDNARSELDRPLPSSARIEVRKWPIVLVPLALGENV